MGYSTDDDIDMEFPTVSDEEELLQSDDESIIVITDDEADATTKPTTETKNHNTQDTTKNKDNKAHTIQDDSPYALLLKHKNFFRQLQRTRPDIYEDLWTVHDKVVESVRRRPCILHPIPGLVGHPCLGKAKIQFHRPIRTGYVSVVDKQTLVDRDTQTEIRRQKSQTTQTHDVLTQTTTTQTERPHDRNRTPTSAIRPVTLKIDQTMTPPRQTTNNQRTMDTQVHTRAQADLSVKVENVLGWKRIDGKWVNIQPPLPGCWICGGADGHRMSECQEGNADTTICFRCGLRGVTVKTCPVHGKSWKRLTPYHRPTKEAKSARAKAPGPDTRET